MRARARAACVVALVAFGAAGCATTARDAPPAHSLRLPTLTPGFELDAETGVLVHVPTGIRLPSEFGGLMRHTTQAYDEAGENVGVGYGAGDRIRITLYVYPRSFGGVPEPFDHFRMVVGDVIATYPGVKVESAGELDLPLGSDVTRGYSAFVRLYEDDRELGSFVVLLAEGQRFVKVRTTFAGFEDKSARDAAWHLSTNLLRSLPSRPWPP